MQQRVWEAFRMIWTCFLIFSGLALSKAVRQIVLKRAHRWKEITEKVELNLYYFHETLWPWDCFYVCYFSRIISTVSGRKSNLKYLKAKGTLEGSLKEILRTVLDIGSAWCGISCDIARFHFFIFRLGFDHLLPCAHKIDRVALNLPLWVDARVSFLGAQKNNNSNKNSLGLFC